MLAKSISTLKSVLGLTVLWLAFSLSFLPQYVAAQNTSNKGTNFWLGYMGHIDGTGSQMNLYITSDVTTNGLVRIPGQNWTMPFVVTANTVTVVAVPPATAYVGCSDCTQDRGIHVTSTLPIVVYSHIYRSARSDATLVLPVPTLGREYLTMCFTQNASGANRLSEFMVVGVEDNTQVEITPSVTVGSRTANVPYNITLDQGEVYQLQSQTDLTGSKVVSVSSSSGPCKRIAVFSGSSFTPLGCPNAGSGDNLYQQLYPASAWGRNFVTAPLKTRLGGDQFRVLAKEDNTQITINGATPITLDATEFHDFQTAASSYVTATKPITLAQYPRTQGCDNVTGDPTMIILNPIEQAIKNITLYSSPNFNITGQYINVIMKTSDTASFTLDNNSVPFTVSPNNSNYAYSLNTVTQGNHQLSADSGFNAIAYGFGNVEAYGYSAGTNVINLEQNITVDQDSLCEGETFNFNGFASYIPLSWTWHFGDGQTDTGQTVSHQYSSNGTYTVSLVTVKTNGTDCDSKDSTTYTVSVRPYPEAGFRYEGFCTHEFIRFVDTSKISSSSELVSWFWDFGDGQTATNRSPIHQYDQHGTYDVKLVVRAQAGCLDSITQTVTIHPAPIPAFGPTSTCHQDTTNFSNTSTVAAGVIIDWYWDFGDGDTAIIATPDHYYSSPGNYDVKLILTTNEGCIDSMTQAMPVYNKPNADFALQNVCFNDTAFFSDQSTVAANTLTKWQWSFGDGANDTLSSPAHYYNSSGNYTVALKVFSNQGCNDSTAKSIDIHPKPTADFSIGGVCLNDSILFTDLTQTNGSTLTSWTWSFGDGLQGVDSIARHQYTSTGTYDITLIASTDSACSDTLTKALTIFPNPNTDFSVQYGCVYDSVQFIDQTSIDAPAQIVNWFWEFDDGNFNNQASTSHLYLTPGQYEVKLTTVSNNICADTLARTIHVHPQPVSDYVLQNPCFIDSSHFVDQSWVSTGAVNQWFWDFGDGQTQNQQHPSHVYDTAGSYTIQLITVTDSLCYDTTNQTFFINPLPNANFSVNNDCVYDSLLFNNTSTISKSTITDWTWDFGDGSSSSNNEHESHLYSTEGQYWVSLIGNSFGCMDTMSQWVTVYPSPTLDFSLNQSCFLDSAAFTNNSSIVSGSIDQWFWDFDDGNSSTRMTPKHIFPSSQIYNIQLVGISNFGCADTLEKAIQINPPPTGDFSMADACAEDPVIFTDLSTTVDGQINSWLWDFGTGDTSTQQNPIYRYIAPGTYTVTLSLITSQGCDYPNLISKPIVIYPLPVADFSAEPDSTTILTPTIAFNNTSQSAQNWLWEFGNTLFSNDFEPEHKYNDTGRYAVRLVVTSTEGCLDTAIHEVVIDPHFALFVPNSFSPNGDGNNDVFFPQGEGFTSYTLSIFDRWGGLVYEDETNTGWNGLLKGGAEAPTGVYGYNIKVVDFRNRVRSYTGTVTLLK